MARILLTGATGFIGSNLLLELLKRSHDVTALDNLRSGHLDFIKPALAANPNKSQFYASSFDSPHILSLVEKQYFDVIVHLAAIPRIGYSIEHPIETHETNVDATLNLIEAARVSKTKFVFASSSSIYGEQKTLPMVETMTPDIRSPYAHQKYTIETYLKLYANLYSLDACSLRFFSVFGPNSLGNSSYPTVVGSWLTAIKKNEPIKLQGHGNQARDFCFIDNVVSAVIKAVEHNIKLSGDVFNVACGHVHSLNDIKEKLAKRFDFEVQMLPAREADIGVTLADISKAKNVLGYEPLVLFDEGLQKTADWYDDNWHWIEKL